LVLGDGLVGAPKVRQSVAFGGRVPVLQSMENRKYRNAVRRTRVEVLQLVAGFVSGMRRSELSRSRGLSFGTLNRHFLKTPKWTNA
jgi:hypothetical protein